MTLDENTRRNETKRERYLVFDKACQLTETVRKGDYNQS